MVLRFYFFSLPFSKSKTDFNFLCIFKNSAAKMLLDARGQIDILFTYIKGKLKMKKQFFFCFFHLFLFYFLMFVISEV